MWGSSMMGWHVHGAGIWWGLASVILWIVVIAVLLFAVMVLLTRSRPTYRENNHGGDSAMTILKARYAKGEITTEQFQEMRRQLECQDDLLD